jgi:hypothetical protein
MRSIGVSSRQALSPTNAQGRALARLKGATVPTDPAGSPAFSIRVAERLFLDSENRFHSTPVEGAPVYKVGGGLLSLSTETRNGLLSGQLAVLPLKEEPGWANKLRDLNVSEDVIELFGKAAGLVSDVVTVIGWAQAAVKILKWVGILQTGKSVEQLAAEILAGVELIQSMQVEGQEHNVKAMLDDSRATIDGLERQARGPSIGGPLLEKDLGGLTAADRRDRRRRILDMAGDIDIEVGKILSRSRWELFLHPKHYVSSWAPRIPNAPPIKVVNPPWWRSFVQLPELRRLQRDGSWTTMTYPTAFKLRFDYRAALPHALHGVMAYLTTLKLGEPEFRSTGTGRDSLLTHADAIALILEDMRGAIVRTHHEWYDFRWVAGVQPWVALGLGLPEPNLKRPTYQWRVGAIDLCAHTDSYFEQQAVNLYGGAQRPPHYRLGVLDFDWSPPALELAWVPDVALGQGQGHWTVVDRQQAALDANRQAERDHLLLLQLSGYFQLAQLEAALRHLATDPDGSETVVGSTRMNRRRTERRDVEVIGDSGIVCPPEKVRATGVLEEFRCEATVRLSLQPPDRATPLLPVKVLLVALDAPADSVHPRVMSECELWPRAGATELSAVQTFDWYVTEPSSRGAALVTERQLDVLAGRQRMVFSHQSAGAFGLGVEEVAYDWLDVDLASPWEESPHGEARNPLTDTVSFDASTTEIFNEAERKLTVRIASRPGTRNLGNLYVVVEERLASKRRLRTYFDVHMHTQITNLPESFFVAERECLEATTRVIEHIETHYSKSAGWLPLDVPVTIDQFRSRVQELQSGYPDLVLRAVRGLQR